MQLRETTLLKLESICRAENVKLLAVRSYGLVASLRVCAVNECLLKL